MQRLICIYHSRDLDGFTSGAIVKRKYPDATLIGYDYGQELPMDQIPEGVPVIMVDVSMPMPKMEALAKHSGMQLTWIDHHISAIKEFEAYAENKESFMVVFLKNGVAACELAWQYLFPLQEIPEAVRLLGEYDTWRNQDQERWEKHILPFQFGMRSVCNSPETFPIGLFWGEKEVAESTFIERTIWPIMEKGIAILQYEAQQNQLRCKRAAFEANFGGLRAICLNIVGINSDGFKSVYDESKHDVMMPFFYDGNKWVVSLYTTKEDVDCSLIAKQNGGGGHKKAAGFEAKQLDFFTRSTSNVPA